MAFLLSLIFLMFRPNPGLWISLPISIAGIMGGYIVTQKNINLLKLYINILTDHLKNGIKMDEKEIQEKLDLWKLKLNKKASIWQI